jgi:hypothetical protein
MRFLMFLLVSFIIILSCQGRKITDKVVYGDSSTLAEVYKELQYLNEQMSIDDRSWPLPVKGFMNYHMERPLFVSNKVAGYTVREWQSDTLDILEAYAFSTEGNLIAYSYRRTENGELMCLVKYLFKNRMLIDSSTARCRPPSTETILKKGDGCYLLANNHADSLSRANQTLKDSLDIWRTRIKMSRH